MLGDSWMSFKGSIIYFPKPLLMDIWAVSNFLLLETVQRISLYIYLCALVGEFFIGGLLLMPKHDRFRMLHVECSRDVTSVLRRAQLGKSYSCFPLIIVLTRDLSFHINTSQR